MANAFDDTNHAVRFDSPLAGDLVVRSMSGQEEMGRLFTFQLELLSQDPELHFDRIVGQSVTVSLDLSEGERYFNGYITEFSYLGQSERYSRYKATLRPWLWFLTRTSDCRIFQEMTVPDIIKQVFRDNGMADFSDRLARTYRDWEYCVQYRESDFAFISRLMEQEGIYYFFEHESGKHTLVMADDISAHNPFPGFSTVPYFPPSGQMMVQNSDHIEYWVVTQSIKPDKYAIQDFDFKKPKVDLISKFSKQSQHAYPLGDPEIFDYPGEYLELSEGKEYVEVRLQESRCQHERVQAGGACRGMSPGCLFMLEDHPREDQNKEYLIISITHEVSGTDYLTGGGGGGEELYRCHAEVMDKEIPYRSARKTPRPIVRGPQTAIVVGPANEEIYTDEYGRVKVQFHWDRYGAKDENSSCWIRVSQAWAGSKWGGIHIPRIGQEVIVSFMEGDPDQPVITGRVYNADCMPPYTLESSKTQSGIKSRSTKGGGPDNFNELRMEDKKGSEELYIQAEKDENILVKNDKGETVGHDETITIGHNRTENVGMDETLTVANNRTRTVMNNETVTVAKLRTHTVGINENINVGINQEVIIGALQAIEVGAVQTLDVGLSQTVSVGKSQSIEVGKDRSLDVGKDSNINVAKDRNAKIGEKESVKIGKDWVVDVGDSVTIKCGAAQIIMKDGNIQLKGTDITFKASGKMDMKASATIKLNGSSIKEN